MGTWTWLHRFPAVLAARASDAICSDPKWIEEHATGTIDTGRAWHALHVLLTATDVGGEPPASWVVYDGPVRLHWEGRMSGATLTPPEDVAFIAAFLRYQVSFDVLLAERYPRLFDGTEGIHVYSFAHPGRELDMVESGLLRSTFDEVRDFYVAAASRGEVVVKSRA